MEGPGIVRKLGEPIYPQSEHKNLGICLGFPLEPETKSLEMECVIPQSSPANKPRTFIRVPRVLSSLVLQDI